MKITRRAATQDDTDFLFQTELIMAWITEANQHDRSARKNDILAVAIPYHTLSAGHCRWYKDDLGLRCVWLAFSRLHRR
jgi:hypothetical protein